MLMPVVIGCRQFVMNILGHGKRRQSEKNTSNPEHNSSAECVEK